MPEQFAAPVLFLPKLHKDRKEGGVIMMRKKNGIAGIPAGIGIGSLVSIMITLIGAAVTAVLITGERIGEQQIVYGSAAALLLGAFIGGLLASSIAGEKRMIVSIGCGIVFFVLLLCVTALVFDGFFENIWTTALLIIGTSAAAGLVGLRRKPTSRTFKKRRVKIP
jgi:putative membrane protein (TIGR04086 family)